MSKVFLLCPFLLLFACGGAAKDKVVENEANPEPSKPTTVEFVLKDSIMIDIIGNLSVYEYNSNTELFLAGDIGRSGVIYMGNAPKFNTLGHLVINKKGEILHRFNKSGTGPESFGNGAMDSFFMGDSSVMVYAGRGLFQYGLDGTFQKKYSEINAQNLVGTSTHKLAVTDNNGNLAIGLAKGMDDAKESWDSLFQIVKPMRFYDLNAYNTGYESLETGEKSRYGYPDHPYYHPKTKYSVSQIPPHVVFNKVLGEVYVMYPIMKRLEVYDMKTGNFKRMIDTKPDYFSEPVEEGSLDGGVNGYEGLLWLNRGGRLASSNYQEIDQLGEYTLLRYNKALPLDVLNPLLVKGYNKDERWPSVRRKHYKFYYQLFKDGKKVVPDFEWSQLEPQDGQLEFIRYSETRGTIIGGDGINNIYVFIPNDGDVERDYELIYIYELKLK